MQQNSKYNSKQNFCQLQMHCQESFSSFQKLLFDDDIRSAVIHPYTWSITAPEKHLWGLQLELHDKTVQENLKEGFVQEFTQVTFYILSVGKCEILIKENIWVLVCIRHDIHKPHAVVHGVSTSPCKPQKYFPSFPGYFLPSFISRSPQPDKGHRKQGKSTRKE